MATYETIRVEKGLYRTGKSFSQALEDMDPTAAYAGTELAQLDAFQRQLKRFDIKVSGANSDRVEKFFQTSDSAALFPEYVARAVRQGMEEADILPQIVATTTNIDALDYRTISSIPGEDEKELKDVAEGAVIPQTTIKTKDTLVKLTKRGRMLVASYEAIRFQRLDLFTVTLKQIGAYIVRSQLKDAVKVLIEGDGNGNAAKTFAVSSTGTISYADLISFWNEFDPYELNTMLVSPDVMEQILNLPEMRDANAGLSFHGTGSMITPMGVKLMKSSAVPAGTVIGLDNTCALEMVQAGEIVTDYDKLIDRQLERATISIISGFSKICDDAVKTLGVK